MKRVHLPGELPNSSVYEETGAHGAGETAPCEPFLTEFDVEGVTGLRHIRHELKPNSPAGNECIFLYRNTPILMVTISPAIQYETYKTMVPKNVKSMFHGPGEEGFIGPDIAGQMPYLLVFRRKGFAVSLTTVTTADTGKNVLSIEQLIAVGTIIDQNMIRQYNPHAPADDSPVMSEYGTNQ